MLIEVAETHPAAPGKKMAAVVATGGQRYGVWPEMLANLRVGGKFEVEVESWQNQGRTLQKITKATPVNGTASTNSTAPLVANGNSNGHAPATAGSISTEAAFVREALAALILKGEVPYTKRALYEATVTLRGLYGATFGGRANGHGGGDD